MSDERVSVSDRALLEKFASGNIYDTSEMALLQKQVLKQLESKTDRANLQYTAGAFLLGILEDLKEHKDRDRAAGTLFWENNVYNVNVSYD